MNDCLKCDVSSNQGASCGARCPRAGNASPARLMPGTVLAGRYLIGGKLGQGGMGVIYDATHLGTNRPVAIKTLHGNAVGDRRVIARFCREARITAALEHPNTIRIFDFGNAGGVFYLAMERLRGLTLAQRLQQLDARRACLEPKVVIRLAIAVLRSLDEAHRAGIVHRDLKPGNIFLHALGGQTLVKVIDFGIAFDCPSHLTLSGNVLGTPDYISPEQVLDGAVDSRADLYSLGIVMYECLTGRVPYAGNAFNVLLQHVQGEVPDPDRDGGAHGGSAVSKALAALVRRALAKKPADRFQTANEMRQALQQLLNMQSQHASMVVMADGSPAAAVHAPTAQQPRVAQAAPPPWWCGVRRWVVHSVGAASLLFAATALLGDARVAQAQRPLDLAAQPPSSLSHVKLVAQDPASTTAASPAPRRLSLPLVLRFADFLLRPQRHPACATHLGPPCGKTFWQGTP